MKRAAIIVAGGSGSRMGSHLAKQFLVLGDRPILMHSIAKFSDRYQIVVVLAEKDQEYWKTLCGEYHFDIPHRIAIGGQSRFESVQNGLKAVDANVELIAVHDGVRPLVVAGTIERIAQQAIQSGAAIPVVEVVDSLRCRGVAVDRSLYRAVQTPQIFKAEILRKSYNRAYDPRFTDDASVVEAADFRVEMVQGQESNIKITTPIDLKLAELLEPV